MATDIDHHDVFIYAQMRGSPTQERASLLRCIFEDAKLQTILYQLFIGSSLRDTRQQMRPTGMRHAIRFTLERVSKGKVTIGSMLGTLMELQHQSFTRVPSAHRDRVEHSRLC